MSKPPSKLNATVHRLPQGLTLIHQALPAASVVVSQVWVNVGANAQGNDHGGLAHFIEHLIFKGSERILPGQFDRLVEGKGGSSKAATGYDYTHFSLTLSPEHFEEGFGAFAEILTKPVFPKWDVEQERAVVLEEIYSYNDDPDVLVQQSLARSLYPCHDYGRSVLGTAESVKDLNLETIKQFHHSHYQPENLTIVIVGKLTLTSAIDLINQHFKTYHPPSSYPACIVPPHPRLHHYDRTEIAYPHLHESRLGLAWHCPGVEQFCEICGLDLLSMILTGHSSALLSQTLHHQPLVWDVASSLTVQKQASTFMVNAWLETEKLQTVEQLIRGCLAKLAQDGGITAQSIKKAKKMLCNDYIFTTETPGQLAEMYGSYGAMADVKFAQDYPNIIQGLTVEQLQGLASKYLQSDRCALTVMKDQYAK